MAEAAVVGQRITAEVIAVDLDEGRVRLAMTATENPELWAFLKRLRRGETLAGTVASKKSDTDECSIAGYMKSSTGNYYTPNLEVC
ncbi:hypothetical protein ACN6K4_004878 [Streptomyces hayashii]|nr:hypothetical protein [Streptomyces scabiei]MDX3112123.1 hypothetical protein [Streptomyces scabiei]